MRASKKYVQAGATPKPETLRWRAAADGLSPEKVVERISANARFLTGTVTVVATTLTAFGLVGASSVLQQPIARYMAVAAFAAVLAAVGLSLSCLVIRGRNVNLENLQAVEAWYRQEFRKAYRLAIAGSALLAGLLLAGSAALVSVIAPARHHVIELDLYGAEGRSIKVSAKASGIQRGSVATIRVAGRTAKGTETLLFTGVHTADPSGLVIISGNIKDVPEIESCRAWLLVDDVVREEVVVGLYAAKRG
jgi:hypothetical protein